MAKRILVVDSDEATLEAIEQAFRRAGLEPIAEPVAARALAHFRETPPAAVLLGVDEEGVAVALAAMIRKEREGAIVPILFVGYAGPADPIRSPSDALASGGDYFFKLPTDLDYLAGRVLGWTGETMSTMPARLDGSDEDAPVSASEADEAEAVAVEAVPFSEIAEEVTEQTAPIQIAPDAIGRARRRARSDRDPAEREALDRIREGERLRATGDAEGAIEAYTAAAKCYEQLGRIDPALAIHKLIVHMDPTRLSAAQHAANLAAEHGKLKDALELLRRPARALETAGMLEESASLIEAMLEIVPADPALILELAELEKRIRERILPTVPPPAGALSFDDASWDAELARELAASEDALQKARAAVRLEVIPVATRDGELRFDDDIGPHALDDEGRPGAKARPTSRRVPSPPTPAKEAPRAPERPDSPNATVEGPISLSLPDAWLPQVAQEPIASAPEPTADDALARALAAADARADSVPPEKGDARLSPDLEDAPEPEYLSEPEPEKGDARLSPIPEEPEPEKGDARLSPIPEPEERDSRASPIPEPEERDSRASRFSEPVPFSGMEAFEEAEFESRFARPPTPAPAPAPEPQVATPLPRSPTPVVQRQAPPAAAEPVRHALPRAPTPLIPNELKAPSLAPRPPPPRPASAPSPAPYLAGTFGLREPKAEPPVKVEPPQARAEPPQAKAEPPQAKAEPETLPIPPPAEDEPAISERPGPLPTKPLLPAQGSLQSLGDALTLLAQLRAQRSTGTLEPEGLVPIVFVHGEPSALRGEAALDTFLGVLEERLGPETPLGDPGDRPVPIARALVKRGKIREREVNVLLHHHLELGVLGLLRHRGGWSFETGTRGAPQREELIPEPDDVRDLLADVLAQVAPAHELAQALGGTEALIRASGATSASPRDARFLALLDGFHHLEDAARLASITLERAVALALVLVGFGRAAVLPTDRSRPGASQRPQPAWLPLGGQMDDEPPAARPPHLQTASSFPAQALAQAKEVGQPHGPLRTLTGAARLRALAELVRTSDYFTILGVAASASKFQIDQAHHQLRVLVRPEEYGDDPELSRVAREVVRSLDEARDVLRVPELRAAYQRHLKP